MYKRFVGRMKIRIISPSGAVDPQRIEQSSAVMRSWGWQVSEGRYARGRFGRFAGTCADFHRPTHSPKSFLESYSY